MAEGGEIRAAAKGIADDVAKGMEDSTAAVERLTDKGAGEVEAAVADHQANDANVKDRLHGTMPGQTASADAASGGENSANSIGLSREQHVAQLTGGQLARGPDGQDIKITMPNVGSSGIDVIGPNGEYIFVGGAAKASNRSKFIQKLHISKYAADQAGVPAIYYLDEKTPGSIVDAAKLIFGDDNVKIFKMGDS
jgi:hypothetical protein